MIRIFDTLHLGRPNVIAVVALETSEGVALFDCGPESTFNHLVATMRSSGVQVEKVRHVFLSHIHLDHAGAAWRLAELGATIHVHPRGAPHLVEPVRLVESARRIFDDAMDRLWGRIAPIPENQVRLAHDNEVVRVGEFEIQTIETPGHANHHNAYQWENNLFGGDVAGVRIRGGPPIPPFVPPELKVEAWLESIDRLRVLGATALYLPHFGVVHDLSLHFKGLTARVVEWSEWFRAGLQAEKGEQTLITEFAEYQTADLCRHGATDEVVQDYESADPSFMAVHAATRYWNKYHPQAIAKQPN